MKTILSDTRRLAACILFVICLLPAYTLFTRQSTSSAGVVLGYSPRYSLILAAYLLLLAGIAFLIAYPQRWLVNSLLAVARFFQRRWLLFLPLAFGLIELWYAVYRTLFITRFFWVYSGIFPVLIALALLELYAFALLLFAGRDPARRRDLLVNSILATVSLVLALIVFAYGFTFVVFGTSYQTVHRIWFDIYRPDPELSYVGRPGVQVEIDGPEPTARTITNDDRGLRVTVPGDTRTAPIAAVGDSFLANLAVADADHWATHLSEELSQPVANYGVIGYSLWQYNHVIESQFPDAGHQLLIYAIFANDLNDDRFAEQHTAYPRLADRWQWGSPISTMIWNFMKRSPVENVLYYVNQERAMAEQQPLEMGFQPGCVPFVSDRTDVLKALIDSRLDEAMTLADDLDLTILFVTIPSKESTYYDIFMPTCGARSTVTRERSEYQAICRYVEQRGQSCYDLTADMIAAAQASDAPLYFNTGDIHWTPEGNAVFAQLLADYITAHDFLDGE